MKIVYEYSYLGGSEILHVRYPDHEREVYESIAEVADKRTKVSKQRTKRGRKLYSPTDMNQQFDKAFRVRGYTELRDTYTITIKNFGFTISDGEFKCR